MKVKARFLASKHGPNDDNDKWFKGNVTKVHDDGSCDIYYDVGEEEEDVQPEFIRMLGPNDDDDDDDDEASKKFKF